MQDNKVELFFPSKDVVFLRRRSSFLVSTNIEEEDDGLAGDETVVDDLVEEDAGINGKEYMIGNGAGTVSGGQRNVVGIASAE